MKNLGVYIKQIGQTEEFESAVEGVNYGILSGKLSDASIFFDGVGPNPFDVKCGMFNSSDLWCFTGGLVVTSSDTARSAMKIVNKFSLYFYYNWVPQKDTLGVLSVVTDKSVKTICRNEKDAKELYRISGVKPIGLAKDFKQLVDIIGD